MGLSIPAPGLYCDRGHHLPDQPRIETAMFRERTESGSVWGARFERFGEVYRRVQLRGEFFVLFGALSEREAGVLVVKTIVPDEWALEWAVAAIPNPRKRERVARELWIDLVKRRRRMAKFKAAEGKR